MIRKLCSLAVMGLIFTLATPSAPAAALSPAELFAAGHADEAIAALQSQLRAAPRDAEAHALLLRVYYAIQRWDDAIAEGQQMVALDPNNSNYHLWLGRAYGEKAERSPWFQALFLARKTRAEFERAVALNSSNVDARSDLAEFYIEAPSFLGGSKEKALAEANQVRVLGDEPSSLWIRAKLAQSEKNYALAEQHLRAAIVASKGNPETMINLASFYRQRGRMDEMEKMIDQAEQSSLKTRRSEALLEGADLLYRGGRNFAGALQLVRKYLNSPRSSEDPPVFQAHYLQGSILEKLGEKQAASEQYRAALSLASGFEPAQTALKRVQ
jgi:tetratricopeptide (TPR) repeat protein